MSVRGTGFFWGFVLGLPLAAALIVFVAQNTQDVTVHWTVWKVHTSLVVVVLVTIFAAVLLAELVGFVWRHRRRRQISRQESMKAERGRQEPTPAPKEPEPSEATDGDEAPPPE